MSINENGFSERKTILVTGATGNVGRHVVSQLLDMAVPVRAVVRNPGSVDLPDGVEIVRGDLAEPSMLGEALAGVEAVFLVWPGLPTSLAPAVLDELKRHARRVVYLSSMSIREGRAQQAEPITDFHATIEKLIEGSDLNWTFLRISGLATNTLGWAQQTRSGDVVRWPYAAAARTLIHEKDVAAVAVRALTSDRHNGAKYILTGPQVLTQAEQVQAIGEAIGRPLRYEEISPEVIRQQMLTQLPPAMVDGMLNAWAGFVREPEPISSIVEEITGTPAHTYKEWAIDHARDFS
ncbi:nucleotide-diphosphate-sugar epimerase [Ktedonobacter sp. SOSP1-85]|uniref:NAD(P)H-binding protein n=1 Tax=Ktedonobacter sp. SOSP1-85 TaxID=2778367 RepID=UPI0019169CD6|nr:NAD(P)H-binding protein [Ktedonobacter sp. SOSP1-85]GHO78505.1 nucleotide-diphosphate-sugar epimerase [Ktedonobacter sp. SOSP1-85]